MTTKHHSTVNSDSSGRSARWLKQYKLLLAACLGLVTVSSSQAQNLQWAPNGTGPSDGSGTWLAGNNWWNGTAIVSGTWTGTTPNGATLGDGTAGSYLVDLGAGSVSLTNLAFTTSGYNVTDGGLNFYDPSAGSPFNAVNVSSGVSATISAAITNASAGIASTFTVGSGGTLTLTGGGYLNANTETTGAGTVDFNSGTYSGPNFVLWSQGNVTQEAATLNISRLLVGYGGNSTYTINNANAVLTGSGGGGNNLIGRSGSAGVMDLKQGTVNMTASGNSMRIAYDANSKGTLTVEGGTLNLGTAANDFYVNYGGTGAPGAGTLNISGISVVTAKGILLGGGSGVGTYVAGSSATVNISGGTTYVGSDGINVSANVGTLTSSINLSGGIVGAAAAWTSTANMVLGTTGGNITFQTADATSVGHNITLNGVLSGSGGLIHTGSGILSLGGVNTYLGNTTVNGTGSAILSGTGHLAFNIGANGVNNQINGTEALTLDGTFDINLTGADTTAGDVWDINADNANTTYGGTFDLTGFTQNGNIWTDGLYQYSEGNGELTIAGVPEPSTTSAALFGGVSLFLASRRLIRKK
jgi:fibronectin-binding autotransporter adhesin